MATPTDISMNTSFRIVNTDNFDGDYPNESFLSCVNSKGVAEPLFYGVRERAQKVADMLNGPFAEHNHRWWKVVPGDYVLQPGFEPAMVSN